MGTMVTGLASPVMDQNYDLIHVLQESLQHIGRLETYIADADARGDTELATWFRKMQENNRKASEQGKKMLMARLQEEMS
ncbi:hypothetical protein [Micromonospora sp. NPDC047074]|uniref:hypothetical protein n=1 Tax=Micromonospora sp. NPDC047074 TaxID=3154339 RepID=UPI0033FC5792